jgi:hypothetical protein
LDLKIALARDSKCKMPLTELPHTNLVGGMARMEAVISPSSVRFEDWTGSRSISTIGTNAGSTSIPFQDWRRFKEAFAPELIERAVKETPGPVRHIVDPFGGSGTTALAAQFLGISPTTIEVNPFLADLIEAKVLPLNVDEAARAFGEVVAAVADCPGPAEPVFVGAPATFVEPGKQERFIFSKAVARRILAHRSAIENLDDPAARRLFRVILAAALIPASNVVVSGKGRRYRRGWEQRPRQPELVDQLFRDGVLRALYELRLYSARPYDKCIVLRGDARELAGSVGEHDLAVFSPPYPNSFDYTDVYNVELWCLGYLDSKGGNASLRSATLRSHMQINRSYGFGELDSPSLARTVASLRAARSTLWDENISEMVGAYAADMNTVMVGLAKGLRKGGRTYMVVGDSRYAGVDVPVAKILSELAPSAGYRVLQVEESRSMRASPQQGGRAELPESLVILERC